MKKYRIHVKSINYLWLDVEANTEEEAYVKGTDTNNNEYTNNNSGVWKITGVNKLSPTVLAQEAAKSKQTQHALKKQSVINYKTGKMLTDTLPRHGSLEDRGSADRYYGRKYHPHYYIGNSYNSKCIEGDNLTVEDNAAYTKGWTEQIERKDWGWNNDN